MGLKPCTCEVLPTTKLPNNDPKTAGGTDGIDAVIAEALPSSCCGSCCVASALPSAAKRACFLAALLLLDRFGVAVSFGEGLDLVAGAGLPLFVFAAAGVAFVGGD